MKSKIWNEIYVPKYNLNLMLQSPASDVIEYYKFKWIDVKELCSLQADYSGMIGKGSNVEPNIQNQGIAHIVTRN